jgi:hypothetical protein
MKRESRQRMRLQKLVFNAVLEKDLYCTSVVRWDRGVRRPARDARDRAEGSGLVSTALRTIT